MALAITVLDFKVKYFYYKQLYKILFQNIIKCLKLIQKTNQKNLE